MDLEALSCPTCGAPVSVREADTLTMCVYCNGALRVHRPTSGPTQIAADTSVSSEVVERIKALIVQGDRAGATALHQAEAKCDRATSEAAIDAYVAQIVTGAIFSSTLNAFGICLFVGSLALVGGGVALGLTGTTSWLVALLPIAFGALNAAILSKAAVKTLRYLSASRGTATILRQAVIGKANKIVSYRLLLEVRDPAGAVFHTEQPFPVAEANVGRVTVGRRFKVKFFPGDPSSVVFAGKLEPGAAGA